MDDKVKAIQERLRSQFGASMVPGKQFEGVPMVVFDEVAGLPTGGETFVEDVLSVLKNRGWKVAHLVRQLAAAGDDGQPAPADSGTSILIGPDRVTISRPLAPAEGLDAALQEVREGYDIVIGQNFGFAIVPRILMTRRVQEGFNLGLPHVVAYVSDSELDVAIPHFTTLDVEAMADFVEQLLGLERRSHAENAAAPEQLETIKE